MPQSFEVRFARSARRKQDQHRRGCVRLVTKTVDPAGWDVHEVALLSGTPLLSIVQCDRAVEDEERFGDGLVNMRRRPTLTRSHVPSIKAEVAARLIPGEQVMARP